MVQILDPVPSFGQTLARNLGAGLSSGLMRGAEQLLQNRAVRSNQRGIVESLLSKGVSPQDAELYSQLTTGGQTQFAKDILEARRRGGEFRPQSLSSLHKLEPKQEEAPSGSTAEIRKTEVSPEEELDQEILGLSERQDLGLTPAERVRREEARAKTNFPVYKEASDKLRSFAMDKERLNILEGLNRSEKLPKNLGRLNVDKEGNLKFPFAGSPEAQRYVKTLNEFSSGAKDTFGSRVTNFDLSQYLKRFPTLLNSGEGRKQLLQQMKIVNDINSIYYKNLKNVYEKAGCVRRIDPDQASSIAERLSEQKIGELTKKFQNIGTFTTLPRASEHAGKKIRDKETGELLISNGTDWVPVE